VRPIQPNPGFNSVWAALPHRSWPAPAVTLPMCSSMGSVQLLPAVDGGPFAAPGAEAPLVSLDERCHAACRSRPPTSLVSCGKRPATRSPARGASPPLRRLTLGRQSWINVGACFYEAPRTCTSSACGQRTARGIAARSPSQLTACRDGGPRPAKRATRMPKWAVGPFTPTRHPR
jgi:hypothetical protein